MLLPFVRTQSSPRIQRFEQTCKYGIDAKLAHRRRFIAQTTLARMFNEKIIRVVLGPVAPVWQLAMIERDKRNIEAAHDVGWPGIDTDIGIKKGHDTGRLA